MSQTFTALQVSETADRQFSRSLVERSTDQLPDGEVLIEVAYSSLNYKDALSATGNKGVTRSYPHTPGIDAAGRVADSSSDDFGVGDEVLVTGFDLGMNTAGGYGGYIRVPAGWVVKLPAGLGLRDSMVYGTAGFTAALSVAKLRHAGLQPEQGEVLVTGASGGVGSIGVALLAKLGYRVVAGSGKPQAQELLRELGAKDFVGREELADDGKRPLLKERWAGVLDTVGGDILASALKAVRYGGCVSCCGLVASPQLSTSVFPFILRGVDLLGVDSVALPMAPRLELWQHLAGDWRLERGQLDALTTEVDLETLNSTWIDKILAGQVQGRVLVKL